MNPSTSTNVGSNKQEHKINIPPTPLKPPPLPPQSKPTYYVPSTNKSPLSPPKLPCGDLLGNRDDYFDICVPLYEAAISGNWEAAEAIFGTNPEFVGFAITEYYDTALHVAASAEETNLTETFVSNLVNLMTQEQLELQNNSHNTALCLASAAGNMKMTRIMVKKNHNLVNIRGSEGMMPLYMSALHGKYNTVKYLYDASEKMTGDYWTPNNKGWILLRCVECDFFDIALKIVSDRPELAKNALVFGALARKCDALNKVQHNSIKRRLNSIFRIRRVKVAVGAAEEDTDALKLLKIIWSLTIKTMPKDKVLDILRGPRDPTPLTDTKPTYSSRVLFVAAEMGNTRFVVELLRAYPDLIWKTNDDNYSIFHVAIMNRHQDIYNLMYEIGSMKDLITPLKDKDGNNMLHLVGLTLGKTATKTSRASLLMQRELLWFKEVEKMIPPVYRNRKNKKGQTPYEIFSEKNHSLVVQSLKWVKDCMLVATLIVTIAFAVAFTVPGGYKEENGLPLFTHDRSFLVFVIADALSLFSSATSLIVYLSILASRYDQHDSLFSLSKKLMMGLVTLFFSVAAMMVTFSASFFMLYHRGLKWVPILIATFAIMPVFTFAALQYRLLVDMFPSMFDSTIQFNPQKRMLYNRLPKTKVILV